MPGPASSGSWAACSRSLTGGLGLLWLWIDRDELTWHDRLAGTRVVVLPKSRD